MKLDKNITNSKKINRFKTLEDDFNKEHKDKYNYDLFVYSGSHETSIITCSIHGEFIQNPTNHLQGKGCKKCSIEYRAQLRIKKRGKKFISDAKKIHGNTYDYSKTLYSGAEEKCIFICKVHGEFTQFPFTHLNGSGCDKCGYISMAEKLSEKARKTFIKKASKIHNNIYNYNRFIYKSNRKEGIIICPIHGEFLKTPVHHINRKQGCQECAIISMAQKQSEEARKNFKNKVTKLHNGKYDYSKFKYINSSTESIVICNKCLEEFLRTPDDHLRGRGCPKCNTKRDNNAIYIWKAINELYDDKPLYKIGVTSSRLRKNRIVQVSGKLGWDYEIILIEDVTCKARELEKKIHKLGTNPKLTGFDGATEMRVFDEEELKKAINIIKPFIKRVN